MKYLTDDVRITGTEEVIAPESLIAEQPMLDTASRTVYETRGAISQILKGEDRRLLVVVGPCSIHDPDAAREYAGRLLEASQAHVDDLLIIMRVYFEKPRTTVGWKGLINDPHLNGSFDINAGLRTARGLLRDVAEMGLGTGTEYLDPITPQYLGDLVSWGAIGARTTESQVHRQLASGLSCPVGFKNSTDGSIQVAVDAIKSANHEHIFLSVTKRGHSAKFTTSGNGDCHLILRGGGGKTNFDNPSVHYASRLLDQAGLATEVMIDMSHANSGKDYRQQLSVCKDICTQVERGETRIFGVMLESNLIEGNQPIGTGQELSYGCSITDACIGWDDTVSSLKQLAGASRARGSTKLRSPGLW